MVLGLVCHKVLLASNPDHPPREALSHSLQREPLSTVDFIVHPASRMAS